MSSSGNPTKTSEAKERIKQALLGLLLVLSSFIIIQIINPELTILKSPLTKTSSTSTVIQRQSTEISGSIAPTTGPGPVAKGQFQCEGPNEFKDSPRIAKAQTSLLDMANVLCEAAGGRTMPQDNKIHNILALMTGSKNCTQEDVDDTRFFLENKTSCGGFGASGTVGAPDTTIAGFSLIQSTVPAELCMVTPQKEESWGAAFQKGGLGLTIFTIRVGDDKKRSGAIELVVENLILLQGDCGKNPSRLYCIFKDTAATLLSSLSLKDINILATYCVDSVLGKASSNPVICDAPDSQDITTQGTCTDATGSHEDECRTTPGTIVLKFKCSSNKCIPITTSCGSGNECKDGACVPRASGPSSAVITKDTVSVNLCAAFPGQEFSSGALFDPGNFGINAGTSISFKTGTAQLFGLRELLAFNLIAVVDWCSVEGRGKTDLCSLTDANHTPLSTLDASLKSAIIDYCLNLPSS